jgi:hypothetical protein
MNEKLVQHIKIVLLYIGQIKIQKKHMLVDEKEGMWEANVLYGETNAFIRNVEREVLLTYQTSEVTRKGIDKVEEK